MQGTDIPKALKLSNHKINQLADKVQPRLTEFIKPISNTTITSAGGSVTFSIDKPNTVISFRDSSLCFKFTSAATVAETTYTWDWTKSISAIRVTDQTNLVFNLQNPNQLEKLMSFFRGTEEEDIDNHDATSSTKGNRRLYKGYFVQAASTTSAISGYCEIPMSRFGEFFELENYYNRSITKIEIEFSALSNSGNVPTPTLSDFAFAYVDWNLESEVVKSYVEKLSSGDFKKIKYYYVQAAGVTGETSPYYNQQIALQTQSLDRVGGYMETSAGLIEPCLTCTLDVYINGKILRQGSIRSPQELSHMTLEASNILSSQLFGMMDSFYVDYFNGENSVWLLQTAFEDEEDLATGISTLNQQRVNVIFQGTTTSAVTTAWTICECSGFVHTVPIGNKLIM